MKSVSVGREVGVGLSKCLRTGGERITRHTVGAGGRSRVVAEALEGRMMLAGDLSAEGWAEGLDSQTVLGAVAAAAAISIPDANLEAAVRSALDKPAGEITDEDMRSLTELTAGQKGIVSLAGLQYATNLSSLYLFNNQISDISPLSGLTNLSWLSLINNQISNISPLASLANLQGLYLENNQISDISPVAGLTSLSGLNLGSNQISDITVVSGLTNLSTLGLDQAQISDIGALSALTKLSSLSLNQNQISDISSLSGLTSLSGLYLNQNQISEISSLDGLTNLQVLYLSENQISDISSLDGLTKLSELYISMNQISDISAVAGMTMLTQLDLGWNKLDVSAGSAALGIIEGLQGHGTTVYYTNQDTSAAIAINDNSGSGTDKAVALADTVVGGTSAGAIFTLSNNGVQQGLEISNFAKGGVYPGDFQVTVKDNNGAVVSSSSFVIDAGMPYTVEVRLKPGSDGAKAAKITFNTNDAHAAAVTLNMSGYAFVGASIGGMVFHDRNADGRRNKDESGLAKQWVYLDTDNDGRKDAGEPSVLSDSSGRYVFSDLAAGTYYVRKVAPKLWRVSAPDVGWRKVTLGVGANAGGKDMGLTQMGLVRGEVFTDANGTGVRDAGEAIWAGWTVFVDADNDGALDAGEKSVLADATGMYWLNLSAGTYVLRAVGKRRYTATLPTGGAYVVRLKPGQVLSRGMFGFRR